MDLVSINQCANVETATKDLNEYEKKLEASTLKIKKIADKVAELQAEKDRMTRRGEEHKRSMIAYANHYEEIEAKTSLVSVQKSNSIEYYENMKQAINKYSEMLSTDFEDYSHADTFGEDISHVNQEGKLVAEIRENYNTLNCIYRKLGTEALNN